MWEQGHQPFDINEDGHVSEADRVLWVRELAGTNFGDADLDKAVDFADFLTLSGNLVNMAVGTMGTSTEIVTSGFLTSYCNPDISENDSQPQYRTHFPRLAGRCGGFRFGSPPSLVGNEFAPWTAVNWLLAFGCLQNDSFAFVAVSLDAALLPASGQVPSSHAHPYL